MYISEIFINEMAAVKKIVKKKVSALFDYGKKRKGSRSVRTPGNLNDPHVFKKTHGGTTWGQAKKGKQQDSVRELIAKMKSGEVKSPTPKPKVK